jgi:hypothetical protein
MRKWQILDGTGRSSSSDICLFDVVGACTNVNKKWLIDKAKPKVEPAIELGDTYISTIVKDLLCLFPFGVT